MAPGVPCTDADALFVQRRPARADGRAVRRARVEPLDPVAARADHGSALVEARADPLPADQPERDGLDGRPGGASSRAVADFGANTFLINMGGIVAQYPTRVPFHYPSAFLPPGRDLFGDVVREAHARRIRVIGRFDLSKTQKAGVRRASGMVLRARERRAGRSTTASIRPASTATTTASTR